MSSVMDVRREVLLHPRCEQQGIAVAAAEKVLAEVLPKVKPFRDHPVHAVTALLDWDHRLPSKVFIFRVLIFYDQSGAERFTTAMALRRQEIATRNLYPEFDVADFAGLPSDEAYDIELTGSLGVEAMRLVSPWRREIAENDAAVAIEAVRDSQQFGDVQKTVAQRSPFLGDLETVAWSPPCETGYTKWTMEVWWLTAFDGRMGKGWSFLVDTAAPVGQRVVTTREFSVRAA